MVVTSYVVQKMAASTSGKRNMTSTNFTQFVGTGMISGKESEVSGSYLIIRPLCFDYLSYGKKQTYILPLVGI